MLRWCYTFPKEIYKKYMSTAKHRIHPSPSTKIDVLLHKLALREGRSVATIALELIHKALEVDEDGSLLAIVQQRENRKVRWVSHKDAWA